MQGEEAAALQVLQKVAKWNKKKLPRGRLVLAQEEGEGKGVRQPARVCVSVTHR